MHGLFFQVPNNTRLSGAPRAVGQLVRHPLAEHTERRRGEVGVDAVTLQPPVGRHRAGQRRAPLLPEPPQHMAHPHQQRAQLRRR